MCRPCHVGRVETRGLVYSNRVCSKYICAPFKGWRTKPCACRKNIQCWRVAFREILSRWGWLSVACLQTVRDRFVSHVSVQVRSNVPCLKLKCQPRAVSARSSFSYSIEMTFFLCFRAGWGSVCRHNKVSINLVFVVHFQTRKFFFAILL